MPETYQIKITGQVQGVGFRPFIYRLARQIRREKGKFRVGLSGGVFQNRLLSEIVMQRLQEENFSVLLPEKIPYNDAGLCYGQIIEGFYHAR